MLDVLGLDPLGAVWRSTGPVSDLRGVVDDLVRMALDERASARERKDFAAADRVRDGLGRLGCGRRGHPRRAALDSRQAR